MSREMSRDVSPVRPFPDLMGDAVIADAAINEYKSPRTEPRLPPAEPAARRSSETLKGTTMTEVAKRLEASAPMTRGQERISKAEQRAWAAVSMVRDGVCASSSKLLPQSSIPGSSKAVAVVLLRF